MRSTKFQRFRVRIVQFFPPAETWLVNSNSPSSKTNTNNKQKQKQSKTPNLCKDAKGVKGIFSKQALERIFNNWRKLSKTYYTQCFLTLLYSCSFFAQCSSFLIQDCTFLVRQILLQGMLPHRSGSVDTNKSLGILLSNLFWSFNFVQKIFDKLCHMISFEPFVVQMCFIGSEGKLSSAFKICKGVIER